MNKTGNKIKYEKKLLFREKEVSIDFLVIFLIKN